MMELLLLIIILAGIVAMDTTAGPQFMISKPFVSCSLLGILSGYPREGLLLGMMFQLIWLGYMPLGASRFLDGNTGSFIAASSVILAMRNFGLEGKYFTATVFIALLLGMIFGIIGMRLTALEHRLNGMRSNALLEIVESRGRYSLGGWILAGTGSAFIRGASMGLFFAPLGMFLCGSVLLLPAKILNGLEWIFPSLWGLVLAPAVLLYWTQGMKKFLFTGVFLGILWLVILMLITS